MQALLAELARDVRTPSDRRVWVLSIMARCHPDELPDTWVEALSLALREPRAEVRWQAVQAAAALRATRLDPVLARMADSATEPPEVRLEALRAILPRAPEPSPAAFDFLIGRLGARDDPLARLGAVECLTMARLDDARRLRLLDAVQADALITPDLIRRAVRGSARRDGGRSVG